MMMRAVFPSQWGNIFTPWLELLQGVELRVGGLGIEGLAGGCGRRREQ